ncbi:nitroreductase family protein [Paenibacillus sp. FSL H7-0331]|uniref:nitroreductase family protein n=1 Tax=Paenibacillus sp. FSL H7-0331 TaxID=1920421 RepID=UPI00096D0EA3|nr:nitroreductase family protein [Paenibacillus sp. FSL H7-0331]OMF04291.1 nitroreductase family protein [Paenibacillus sp. FSL H7-0331]
METNVQQVQEFYQVLKERRSVRHYDPTFKISEQELTDILTEATLAPSGANLQPWKFIVFNDQAVKEKLLPIANNQIQVVESSAVIAVLGDLEGYKQAEKIYASAVEAGYMSNEIKENLVNNITGFLSKMAPDRLKNSVLIDCGLVSMQLMLVAKAHGYDTVPMAGFDAGKFIEVFNISDRYVPVMLIAIGKAAQAGHPTVRLPIEDVTFWNGIA